MRSSHPRLLHGCCCSPAPNLKSLTGEFHNGPPPAARGAYSALAVINIISSKYHNIQTYRYVRTRLGLSSLCVFNLVTTVPSSANGGLSICNIGTSVRIQSRPPSIPHQSDVCTGVNLGNNATKEPLIRHPRISTRKIECAL